MKNLHNKSMFYTVFLLFLLNICLQGTTDVLATENNMMKLKLQGLEQQYKLMNGMLFSFLTYQVTYLMFLWWRTKENSDHHWAIQDNTELISAGCDWRWMMTKDYLFVNLYHMFIVLAFLVVPFFDVGINMLYLVYLAFYYQLFS